MNYMVDGHNNELRNARLAAATRGINSTLAGNITGITLLDRAIVSSTKKIHKKLKRHFGLELTFFPESWGQRVTEEMYKWIAGYNHNIKKMIEMNRKIEGNTRIDVITNTSFTMHLDQATFAFVRVGDDYRDMLAQEGGVKMMMTNKQIGDSDMYMYIFGKHAYKYYKQALSILNSKENGTFRMYNIHGDKNSRSDTAFRSLFQDTPKRDMSTIFMEPGTIESITEHIDKYLANRDMYSGRGIIYKTGILLYGEPGTGKTSLIKALASKYDYDLILMDMTTFDSIGLETFTHSVNIDESKYIIALEDIDCVIADRENVNADKDDKKVINKLLQFLDSNSSPNEVIFIASTNHIELLDEALLREGRFDLRVEVGGVKEQKAREMCASFNLPDDVINTIIDDIKASGIDLKTSTIRQSKLQSMILKYSGMNLRTIEEEETPKGDDIGDE